MGDRIKSIRLSLGYTQQQFADKLGLSRNFIAVIETTDRKPSDRTIMDICREFNVSEAWLRDGVGEMFVSRTPDQALAFSLGVMMESGTPFQKRFIRLLSDLPPEDWDKVEAFIEKLNRDE